jgi:hypothetical protein
MTLPPSIGPQLSDLFLQVMRELNSESERGAVVLAFAWMDDELTRALKKLLVPSLHAGEKADELFGVGKPLSEASTKIDLALRLGILKDFTHQSLHIFRKLRNDFAHLASPLSFKTDSVRDRLITLFELQSQMTNALRSSVEKIPEVQALLQPHDGKSSSRALADAFGHRQLFEFLAATMVAGLRLSTHNMPSVLELYPPRSEA